MKVLQINSDFRRGSTGKITATLHDELKLRGIESYVCYGRDYGISECNVESVITIKQSKVQHFRSLLIGDPYSGCKQSTKRVIDCIKRIQPDVVHLQCINGYFVDIYKLLIWLGKNKVKTILTLHAEFMYTGGCDHAFECEQWKTGCKKCHIRRRIYGVPVKYNTESVYNNFLNAFLSFDDNGLVLASVSDWLMQRAKQSPMLSRFRSITIPNGIDTDIFKYYETNEVRSRYTHSGEKMVLYVTAGFFPEIDDNKGGKYVVNLANRLLAENQRIRIVVAANHSNFTKELPQNITFVGNIDNQQDLALLYSSADITLITSKRETFSMPVAESLCCGTPILGFEAGGPESVALPKYSCFVRYGDEEKLYESMQRMISMKYDKYQISIDSANAYSRKAMADQYIDCYAQLEGR